MTVVDSVLKRFNQGLLFDISSNKVNIDKLNSLNENDLSESNSKDDIPLNNPSLSEILKESFSHYQKNQLIKKKLNEQADIYANVYIKFKIFYV